MPKRKTVFDLTDEQEARIQAGISRDPDSREASDAQLAAMRPASEALSTALLEALRRPRGRPKAAETKQAVKLRLDRTAVGAFKRSGPGWQTRMNDAIVSAAAALVGPKTIMSSQKRANASAAEVTLAKPAAKKTPARKVAKKKRAV